MFRRCFTRFCVVASRTSTTTTSSQQLQNPFLSLALSKGYVCPNTAKPWHDDSNEPLPGDKLVTPEDEEAYKFLHRAPLRHGDLGGYGEDFGFHYPPRTFVDPDDPHIYPYLNREIMTANTRELRYSHQRHMLHILDLDKLIRHGRMIPSPPKLLNDLIMTRVALNDRDAGALFRYARTYLQKLGDSFYADTEAMFERMLATLLPPIDMGQNTHTEMIRCCAVVARWDEGNWFIERVMDLKIGLPLRADFYDAVATLCEACGKTEEAWKYFEQALAQGLRLKASTLHTMLYVAAQEGSYDRAKYVFELFDFFEHERTMADYEAFLNVVAEAGPLEHRSKEALSILTQCEHNKHTPSLHMLHTVIYALATTPGHAAEMRDLFDNLCHGDRGLQPDYQTYNYIFYGCALNGDVKLALDLYAEFTTLNSTRPLRATTLHPETVYYLFRALRCVDNTNSTEGYSFVVDRVMGVANTALERLRSEHPNSEYNEFIYTEFFAVCAACGMYQQAFGALKYFVASEMVVNARVLTYLLEAIVRSAPGTFTHEVRASAVMDVFQLFVSRSVVPTQQTLDTVVVVLGDEQDQSAEAVGLTEEEASNLKAAWEVVLERLCDGGKVLSEWGEDPPPPLPPRQFQREATTIGWDLTREDIALSKHGQLTARLRV
eukprot:PhM_4_TR13791/c0_g1_i1/m.74196